MHFSRALLFPLLALATTNPLSLPRHHMPIPATLSARADTPIGQVHLFTFPSCLGNDDLPTAISAIANVTIGVCHNAADTEILASVFTSVRAWTLGTLPAKASCETRAYFDADCGGEAAVTDNRQMGKCFDVLANPGFTKGEVGRSFRIECCEGDGEGSCLFA